jgi:RNA polymerase sigma-70 factor (ECF subfamily)
MSSAAASTDFLAVVNANQGILHRICRLYCSDADDRQDLYQEIVLQLWHSFEKFRGESRFSTWLYRVAINTAISGLRKQKDFISSFEPAQLPVVPDEPPGNEEVRISELYRAVGQLNVIEKAIVMLYLEDRSYDEMQEILGINSGNLRVKMTRIKDKLRQMTKNS